MPAHAAVPALLSVVRRHTESVPSVVRRYAESAPLVAQWRAEGVPSVVRRRAEGVLLMVRRRDGGASSVVGWPAGCGGAAGMIVGVPAPELITDPTDERVADFRDLVAGDRRPGTERGTGPVIVEGVPAVQRLLASPYPVRSVIGIPGRVAALELPAEVTAYEADKWVLSDLIGFRLTRGVLASADRLPPPDLDALVAGPDPAAPRRLAVLEGLNDHENIGSIARSAVALGVDALLLDPHCADPLYRRCVRVSMGHVLTLPIAVLGDWPGGLDRLH